MKSEWMKFLFFCGLLFLSLTTWSQVRKITGKVTSEEDSAPLPGVNIVLKGTTSGTQTDADGVFNLNVNDGSQVLVFSFIGFQTQEIPVLQLSVINVNMKSNVANLGEVVVIGYGEQSRKNLTSAVAKLDNTVLASAPRANLGGAFQGTIPGLQVVNTTGTPGATPYILLRGGASISGAQSPLVVVDGVIRPFNDIAPQDIASVEVLKDAASTAIYGARANNGVILITTKRGKSGTAHITYKSTFGVNQRRQGYNYLNARDYIYYMRQGNLNSGRTLAQVNASRGYGLSTNPADLAAFDIRSYTPADDALLSQGWETIDDPYTPGNKILFRDHSGEVENLVLRNTSTNDQYISVAGGTDLAKYYASFNYYREDGIIVGSNYARYSANASGSLKVRPNIEVSSGLNLSTATQLGVNGSEINNMYRNLTLWPTFNPWIDAAKTKPNPGNGMNDGNPLYWLDKQKRSNESNRVTVNTSIKWDLTPRLYAKFSGNAYLAETLNRSFTMATQNYAQLLSTPAITGNISRPSTNTFSRNFQTQFNGLLNYSKSFNEAHNINAMVGVEYYGTKAYSMQVAGQNAPTDDIATANASTTFASGTNYTTESVYKIISNFGRINYDYKQKYILSLVYRQDGVSSLGSKNRFGFFPGMSAGWNVQNERFFINSSVSSFVSTFKPRISYGVNGNVNTDLVGPYDVQGIYSSTGNYNGSLGFLNSSIINNGLRWEQSSTIDIGVDIGLFQNRITILADYFDKRTKDLIGNLTLPSYMGYGSVLTNVNTLQNKGLELAVNAILLQSDHGLQWDIGANTTFVQNKVLKLPYNGNENNRVGGLQVYDPSKGKVVWVGGLQEGQTPGAIYGYNQVSIFRNNEDVVATANSRIDRAANISGPGSTFGSGKIAPGDVNWLDVDKNDTIDSRDQVYLGNIVPKWTGGFTSNLSYKQFTLHTRFEYALGHTIYNDLVARTLGNYQGTFNTIDLVKRSWTPNNQDTDIPKIYYADQVAAPLGKKNYTRSNNASPNLNGNNSRFYEKGDYLACREVTLSYDFSKEILARTKVLSNARLYCSMLNIFYITRFSGPNPEPIVSIGGQTAGVYQGTYPTPKSFVVGLQVTF